MSRITICDSTLRDGSHAKSHRFSVDEVHAIAAGLDAAGVPVVEVSHGDGLGGSSINYGFSAEREETLLEAAAAALTHAQLAVLLLPGIGVKAELECAAELGASVARVATHCTEADVSPQHLTLARDLGMTAIGFLMMSHLNDPDGLLEQAKIMVDAGAQVIYFADSAGAMTPHDIRARVTALREGLSDDIGIGVHAHENLSLSVANSVAAVEAGADWVDGCTCGLGAGAGNTPTEAIAAVLKQLEWETGLDVFQLMDLAEEVVRPVMDRPQVVNRSNLLLGYAGVYSSFLLHAETASERFDVPVKDIILGVAELQAIGGQEDVIIDVASRLASRK